MLIRATEWCAPGQGSTVKELLDWAPSKIRVVDAVIDNSEYRRLMPFMNERTSLKLVSPEDGEAYDIERIREALSRMK